MEEPHEQDGTPLPSSGGSRPSGSMQLQTASSMGRPGSLSALSPSGTATLQVPIVLPIRDFMHTMPHLLNRNETTVTIVVEVDGQEQPQQHTVRLMALRAISGIDTLLQMHRGWEIVGWRKKEDAQNTVVLSLRPPSQALGSRPSQGSGGPAGSQLQQALSMKRSRDLGLPDAPGAITPGSGRSDGSFGPGTHSLQPRPSTSSLPLTPGSGAGGGTWVHAPGPGPGPDQHPQAKRLRPDGMVGPPGQLLPPGSHMVHLRPMMGSPGALRGPGPGPGREQISPQQQVHIRAQGGRPMPVQVMDRGGGAPGGTGGGAGALQDLQAQRQQLEQRRQVLEREQREQRLQQLEQRQQSQPPVRSGPGGPQHGGSPHASDPSQQQRQRHAEHRLQQAEQRQQHGQVVMQQVPQRPMMELHPGRQDAVNGRPFNMAPGGGKPGHAYAVPHPGLRPVALPPGPQEHQKQAAGAPDTGGPPLRLHPVGQQRQRIPPGAPSMQQEQQQHIVQLVPRHLVQDPGVHGQLQGREPAARDAAAVRGAEPGAPGARPAPGAQPMGARQPPSRSGAPGQGAGHDAQMAGGLARGEAPGGVPTRGPMGGGQWRINPQQQQQPGGGDRPPQGRQSWSGQQGVRGAMEQQQQGGRDDVYYEAPDAADQGGDMEGSEQYGYDEGGEYGDLGSSMRVTVHGTLKWQYSDNHQESVAAGPEDRVAVECPVRPMSRYLTASELKCLLSVREDRILAQPPCALVVRVQLFVDGQSIGPHRDAQIVRYNGSSPRYLTAFTGYDATSPPIPWKSMVGCRLQYKRTVKGVLQLHGYFKGTGVDPPAPVLRAGQQYGAGGGGAQPPTLAADSFRGPSSQRGGQMSASGGREVGPPPGWRRSGSEPGVASGARRGAGGRFSVGAPPIDDEEDGLIGPDTAFTYVRQPQQAEESLPNPGVAPPNCRGRRAVRAGWVAPALAGAAAAAAAAAAPSPSTAAGIDTPASVQPPPPPQAAVASEATAAALASPRQPLESGWSEEVLVACQARPLSRYMTRTELELLVGPTVCRQLMAGHKLVGVRVMFRVHGKRIPEVFTAELERYGQHTPFYLKATKGLRGQDGLPWRELPDKCMVQWRRMADDILLLAMVSGDDSQDASQQQAGAEARGTTPTAGAVATGTQQGRRSALRRADAAAAAGAPAAAAGVQAKRGVAAAVAPKKEPAADEAAPGPAARAPSAAAAAKRVPAAAAAAAKATARPASAPARQRANSKPTDQKKQEGAQGKADADEGHEGKQAATAGKGAGAGAVAPATPPRAVPAATTGMAAPRPGAGGARPGLRPGPAAEVTRVVATNLYIGKRLLVNLYGPKFEAGIKTRLSLVLNDEPQPDVFLVEWREGVHKGSFYPKGAPLGALRGRYLEGLFWKDAKQSQLLAVAYDHPPKNWSPRVGHCGPAKGSRALRVAAAAAAAGGSQVSPPPSAIAPDVLTAEDSAGTPGDRAAAPREVASKERAMAGEAAASAPPAGARHRQVAAASLAPGRQTRAAARLGTAQGVGTRGTATQAPAAISAAQRALRSALGRQRGGIGSANDDQAGSSPARQPSPGAGAHAAAPVAARRPSALRATRLVATAPSAAGAIASRLRNRALLKRRGATAQAGGPNGGAASDDDDDEPIGAMGRKRAAAELAGKSPEGSTSSGDQAEGEEGEDGKGERTRTVLISTMPWLSTTMLSELCPSLNTSQAKVAGVPVKVAIEADGVLSAERIDSHLRMYSYNSMLYVQGLPLKHLRGMVRVGWATAPEAGDTLVLRVRTPTQADINDIKPASTSFKYVQEARARYQAAHGGQLPDGRPGAAEPPAVEDDAPAAKRMRVTEGSKRPPPR